MLSEQFSKLPTSITKGLIDYDNLDTTRGYVCGGGGVGKGFVGSRVTRKLCTSRRLLVQTSFKDLPDMNSIR